jgi:hypothetical protein
MAVLRDKADVATPTINGSFAVGADYRSFERVSDTDILLGFTGTFVSMVPD